MSNSKLLLLLVIGLFAVSAPAQTGTSSITGRVVDAKEALVAGATVTLTNEATRVTQTLTTSDSGLYAFNSLPPGSYTITVEAPGFKTFSSTGNVLTVGSPIVVNVSMEIGQQTERVEVTSSFERIETTSAMLGGVVDRKAITELPLNGRNPLNLIVLEPGLVQRTTGGAGSGTHVFGSRDRAHNVTIDGIDANESSVPNPQSNVFRLTPDNVQEYRVVTHNATPEFGRNSGANVTVATRSGGNDFHGDIFYFHRNTALNANEWFNNAS
ncbi:MAG TPA: carboxypeptidase-like regulatory domain-containing protein, partial [Pyrinomonadaceae bacterium]|nr:carboxypeptidase-like regulatory domain-containing protein [Pyrinomonadaceae bacterium]